MKFGVCCKPENSNKKFKYRITGQIELAQGYGELFKKYCRDNKKQHELDKVIFSIFNRKCDLEEYAQTRIELDDEEVVGDEIYDIEAYESDLKQEQLSKKTKVQKNNQDIICNKGDNEVNLVNRVDSVIYIDSD